MTASEPIPPDARGRAPVTERMLLRVMIILAAFQGARMFVGSYSIAYLTAHGVTLVQVGVLKSIQMGLLLALDVPSSHLADRFGRRAALWASFAAASVWLGLSGISTGFAAFAVAEGFNAVSLAIGSGVAISYVIGLSQASPSPPRIAEVTGRAGQWSTLAMAAAALLGTYGTRTDSRWPWLAASGGCAAVCCVSIVLFPDDLRFRPAAARGTGSVRSACAGFLRDVREAGLGGLALWSVYVAVVAQVFIQFWQVGLLSRAGAGTPGRAFGIAFTLILLGQYAAARLVRAIGPGAVRAVVLTTLAVAAAALLGLRGHAAPLMVAALTLTSFGVKLAALDVQSRLHDRFPERCRATYDSLVSTFARIVLIPVLFGAGIAADAAGVRLIGMLAASVCLVLVVRSCLHRVSAVGRRAGCSPSLQ